MSARSVAALVESLPYHELPLGRLLGFAGLVRRRGPWQHRHTRPLCVDEHQPRIVPGRTVEWTDARFAPEVEQ